MKDSFGLALRWVLAHEGGFVNHPDDPGGATNKGITQAVYDEWRHLRHQPQRSVKHITSFETAEIYRMQYWAAVRADDLPRGVDYAVFDYAVNSGVRRAVKELQRVVGSTPDGIIGPKTLAAVRGMNPETIICKLVARRMSFLRRLRHWPTFGLGWNRRVEGYFPGYQDHDTGVIDRAIALARGEYKGAMA